MYKDEQAKAQFEYQDEDVPSEDISTQSADNSPCFKSGKFINQVNELSPNTSFMAENKGVVKDKRAFMAELELISQRSKLAKQSNSMLESEARSLLVVSEMHMTRKNKSTMEVPPMIHKSLVAKNLFRGGESSDNIIETISMGDILPPRSHKRV
ncbi:unnamed protein product [Moneuplotes crassus]|uniref:Uncharacterized protein n=1 Tax=Euplotes crassus TaxID=5936 RepID=A0AAD1XKX9_EUPCR|nr:unnamed protein product [Moneuplotes crassus]